MSERCRNFGRGACASDGPLLQAMEIKGIKPSALKEAQRWFCKIDKGQNCPLMTAKSPSKSGASAGAK